MNNPAFIYDYVLVTPDRQIKAHSHHRWELSYVICGGGVREIGDRSEPICEGEIILIPPDISHVWRFDPAITDSDGYISNISVFFEPQFIDGMINLCPELTEILMKIKSQTQAIYYSGEVYDSIRKLLLSMRGLSPADRFPHMICLLTAISDISGGRAVGRNNTLSRVEQRKERIRIYCACNYTANMTLEETARHTGMNKSAFCSFMKAHFGMTFTHYINGLRLEKAREKLLHSDCGIAEISADCGFMNVTYFNRLFRARFGMTPKDMRSRWIEAAKISTPLQDSPLCTMQ